MIYHIWQKQPKYLSSQDFPFLDLNHSESMRNNFQSYFENGGDVCPPCLDWLSCSKYFVFLENVSTGPVDQRPICNPHHASWEDSDGDSCQVRKKALNNDEKFKDEGLKFDYRNLDNILNSL